MTTRYDNVSVIGKVASKTLQVEKGSDNAAPTIGQALVAADSDGNLKYATISGTDVNVAQDPISTNGEFPIITKGTTATASVTGSVAFESDGGVTLNPSTGKVTVKGLKVSGGTPSAGQALVAADSNGNVTWGNATPSEYLKTASVASEVLTITKQDGSTVHLDISGKADETQLSDGSVTKVGTATVGAVGTPIYLNGGMPTAGTPLGDAAYKGVEKATLSDESGLATKDYVDAKATSVFTYKGSDTYANIILKTDNVKGDVWNSTTSFVISSGSHAGTYPAGTNLVCTTTQAAASASIWDPLGGDISTLVPKTGNVSMTGPLNYYAPAGLAINTNAFRNISAGSSGPSGGSLGDVYLQVGGTPHVGTSTVGSATQPIYLDSGVPTAASGSVVKTASGSVSVSATATSVTTSYGGTNFAPKIVQLFDGNTQVEAGITLTSTGFTINVASTPATAYSWTYNAIGW